MHGRGRAYWAAPVNSFVVGKVRLTTDDLFTELKLGARMS